jgi:hypothetical protein
LPEFSDIEPSQQVDGLIVVDRSVDWVTPMCTQLTYEGMLDEYIGIRNCMPSPVSARMAAESATAHIEVDSALLDPQQVAAPSSTALPSTPITKKRKHHLSGQKDRLLSEIRDLNFAVVGSRLSKVARRLEGDYGGVKNLRSVSQMKEFVGKLGGLQSEQQSLRLREVYPSCRLRSPPDEM